MSTYIFKCIVKILALGLIPVPKIEEVKFKKILDIITESFLAILSTKLR